MNHEHNSERDPEADSEGRMYDLLCRYVFDETTESERTEVEVALVESEELRAQKAELEGTVALVQGVFSGADQGSSGEGSATPALSTLKIEELQAAAREASPSGRDFELQPTGRSRRPWYASHAVGVAAAATVLLGLGAIFVRELAPDTRAEESVGSHLEVATAVAHLEQPVSVGLTAGLAPAGKKGESSANRLKDLGYGANPPATIRRSQLPGSTESSSDDFFLGRGEAKVAATTAGSSPGPARPGARDRSAGIPMVSAVPLLRGLWADRYDTEVEAPQRRKAERPRDMFFRFWGDNPFVITRSDALSTFAADVDTASFTLARRMLRQGILPERDQIRTEEFINYAQPDLAPPTEDTFAVYGELAPSPFGGREDRWLLRVGVRAKDVAREERPPLALTFVVDTSGSMRTGNRLELVKHSLRLLVDQLDGRDTLAIVGFSSNAREILPPTPANASDTIETALFGLQPGGGTNAEAGLELGYALSLGGSAPPDAQKRVIFLSDGVANMGQTDQDRLANEISEYAEQGIFLNTIGVGMSNHSDVFLEQLADKGQGVCDYVADAADVRRAIVERFVSGFVTVAKDLKIQVEFDSARVLRWRQLGYENRAVADRDFRNDAVDAGEVGAGHQVTCFYELELASNVDDAEGPLAKVRLRWSPVAGASVGARRPQTRETEASFRYEAIVAPSFRAASAGFRLGALSAQLAECLRQSYHARGDSMDQLATGFANLLTDEPSPDVAAVAEAVKLARDLGLQAPPSPRPTDADAAQREAYYRFLIESLGGSASVTETGKATTTGVETGSSAPWTPEEYESRIRQLLNGDQREGHH